MKLYHCHPERSRGGLWDFSTVVEMTNSPRSARRIKQISHYLYKLNIPPCCSCAEMVGKRRDNVAYSNATPAFAKQRRNTQLFRGTFFASFLWWQRNEEKAFWFEASMPLRGKPRTQVRLNPLSCEFMVRFWLPKNEHKNLTTIPARDSFLFLNRRGREVTQSFLWLVMLSVVQKHLSSMA